jgi:hypothetical protein
LGWRRRGLAVGKRREFLNRQRTTVAGRASFLARDGPPVPQDEGSTHSSLLILPEK